MLLTKVENSAIHRWTIRDTLIGALSRASRTSLRGIRGTCGSPRATNSPTPKSTLGCCSFEVQAVSLPTDLNIQGFITRGDRRQIVENHM